MLRWNFTRSVSKVSLVGELNYHNYGSAIVRCCCCRSVVLKSVLGAMGSRTVVVKGLEPCGKRNKQRTGRDFEFTLSEHANGFWSRSETSSVLACGYYSWCCCWVILSSTRRALVSCEFSGSKSSCWVPKALY